MHRVFLNVGYELSEKQLRGYFVKFGVLSDLYLPKHANGRNKGYGFATFASPESLALALQHPKHVVNGITVQVKRAGPRPPDVFQDAKPALAKVEHVPFGQGPRIYVGGVHECLTETRLREHFTRWGSISDIYFPGARGQKRSNYCFVTFDNRRNAERACSESGRNLDGWSLESICMADDRKVEPDHSVIASLPLPHPTFSTAADMAGRPSYTLWLQLQYQQQLAALQSTVSAAAAHEAPQPSQKAPSSQVGSPPSSFHAHPALEVPSDPYAQSASLYNQLQQQALGLPPQWWLPAVSGAEPAGVGSPAQEALGRPPPMMAIPAGANQDHYAMLAEQSIAYAAEHERQQQQIAARLQAIAAGVGFSPAEMDAGLRPPLLRDPAVGLGRGTARFPGRGSLPHGIPETGYNPGGAAQDFPAFSFPPNGYQPLLLSQHFQDACLDTSVWR